MFQGWIIIGFHLTFLDKRSKNFGKASPCLLWAMMMRRVVVTVDDVVSCLVSGLVPNSWILKMHSVT